MREQPAIGSTRIPLAHYRRAGFAFDLWARDPRSSARVGTFRTPHGDVETPAFMPVGTRGTVKGVLPRDLRELGSTMILANTYHLHVRPGEDVVRALGGLHRFMAWDGPILTDSGGYQVFSLGHLTRIDDEGVSTKSVVDGRELRLTPEKIVDIQTKLGADVIMAFDHCPADPTDRAEVEKAVTRTRTWLDRCRAEDARQGGIERGQALFPIVQGGVFEDLRRASAASALEHESAGYAIGGVSVGEDREQMRTAIEISAPLLPANRPRYLMGVGTPRDFFDAVERGIDLFDCVSATRNARNHRAFTSRGELNLRNAQFKEDGAPLDPECDCPCCTRYSRGVLRHLCVSDEILGGILLTHHNLRYFHTLMERMRSSIAAGTFLELRRDVLARIEAQPEAQ